MAILIINMKKNNNMYTYSDQNYMRYIHLINERR